MPSDDTRRLRMLQTYGYDKYKRTLADVLLPDGTNVNQNPEWGQATFQVA